MTDIPKFMKAVLLKGHGDFDQLEYREDVLVPALGPDDVLVRVGAAAVNNTEINHRIGWYADEEPAHKGNEVPETPTVHEDNDSESSRGMRFPRIQGADVCGRIVATGANVDQARKGERVVIDPLFKNPLGYFGADCDGGFAEYTRASSKRARVINSILSDVELASFPCSYSTAENLLTRSNVVAGDTVLVTGASGGVGSAVVQLAARRNARVIAVTTVEKADQVCTLGAERTVSRHEPMLPTLGSACVDVVIDLVGGPRWPELLDVLKPHGRYAASGAIAGPIVSLDLRKLYFKDLTLYGCTVYERAIFDNLLGYIERNEVKPVIARTFALKDIVQAQKAFLRKDFIGKIVLVP